ncbi:hypothetical protein EN828_25220 [Mesorhizobium sp. M2D.F.Ca.ET.185.01.1.1]|uniref:hypothetical protein n=1 Tax=unclassified Mesorhizobium TaxID=325217 RepID=UPI000FCA34BC|nr:MULTISPECIES: hypothetical protein [unclassified Mesorhizobium]TGP74353.1 hypothetical protein EN870_27040 [bacterium M00.F.Ca.ET.227.01.1.1]TGP85039.1 hypothetical protein EN864_27145 [bacterium M00.F.Ca.ET.221.01.1.1]TGP89122.1 hypothetical protein EN865_25570 [bacterium M00.F.Ca.ET.222.01.1.1]TGU12820.1 hypothetical protein EN806_15695 [bacterium M00.F.Ca.ET.163.01.1.1]TGU21277.1 hypothetical protein EN799_53905 [bacterium M00.F.Ca.ET.156.01.1.1]TGU43674.1 hypothetical protein EN789_261
MYDKFGFRIGSKRSMAASLYERGATQADLVAATGTTQYNMLKDAERRGHRVLVKGDRYWLVAVEDNVAAKGSGKIGAALPLKKQATSPRPVVNQKRLRVEGAPVAAVPAILSVIRWHGKESPEDIVARKAGDIAKTGRTLWVIQSWKAKTDAVQAFGRAYPGALVYFIEGGAIPAGFSQVAVQMSEDRQIWGPLPKGIGKVTGKLAGATALVLDRLAPCDGTIIDLWQFVEHPRNDPLRFMQGASTACVIPATGTVAGMKSRYRRVVAIGRLAGPYAAYLR